MSIQIPTSLGDYEKWVLLYLSNQLSLIQAWVLIAHCEPNDLFVIISNYYDRNRTAKECASAILNIRLTLLQECPCAVCKQTKT